jgi:hypothetical protein
MCCPEARLQHWSRKSSTGSLSLVGG